MPSSGRSASSARRRVGPGGGQPGVGGVGLGEGALAVDRQPGVERRGCRARRRRGAPRSARATRRRRPAGARPSRGRGGGSGRSSAGQRSSRMAGTTMKSPSRAGALARTASTGSDGRDDVVAQDVLELDRLGGRRDVVGRQLGQDRVLVEDVVELRPRAASARRRSARGARDGRRARRRSATGWPWPDDSRTRRRPTDRRARADTIGHARPAIRPMTPADVDPVAAAFLREDWGDRRLNLAFVDGPSGDAGRSSPRPTGRRRDRRR